LSRAGSCSVTYPPRCDATLKAHGRIQIAESQKSIALSGPFPKSIFQGIQNVGSIPVRSSLEDGTTWRRSRNRIPADQEQHNALHVFRDTKQ
jgi:hypothetical protein